MFRRAYAHSELVAEIPRRGFAETGQAQVLAQQGGFFEIEIVERHNAVQFRGPAQMADGKQHVLEVPFMLLVGHVKDVVDAFARPFRRILKTERGQEENAAAAALCFLKEAVSLVIARKAEEGQGRRHSLVH